jgi:hypothetical protein
VTPPRWSRFRRGATDESRDLSELPDDGLCLSSFLVVRSTDRPGEVLVGRIEPDGPWEELGALGPERGQRVGDRWMLPACQLQLFESPDNSARRVARDLLGRPIDSLPAPRIFSEAYRRPRSTGHDPHWDLEFVYLLDWSGPPPTPGRLWRQLEYRAVRPLPPEAFARGHEDVLANVGLRDP